MRPQNETEESKRRITRKKKEEEEDEEEKEEEEEEKEEKEKAELIASMDPPTGCEPSEEAAPEKLRQKPYDC